jgi:small basic protein (TIGR04137 family)
MSIDKSLKRKGGMTRTRCVLKRSERILKMLENGKFAEGQSPFGLPKTRVQKIVIKKKAKAEKAAEGAEGAAAAAPAPGGAAAKPAAGAAAPKK